MARPETQCLMRMRIDPQGSKRPMTVILPLSGRKANGR